MEDGQASAGHSEQLIGIKSEKPIEVVAKKVSEALGVPLLRRDSAYWGDPYYSGWPTSDVKLTENLDPMFREGEPPRSGGSALPVVRRGTYSGR
jgi:hypothetical protein